MVIRWYLKCKVCESTYAIRCGVGVDKESIQSFDCSSCEIPIVVLLKTDPPAAWLEMVDNCETIAKCDEDFLVNLHPCFAFDREDFHSPYAFPSMIYMRMIAPYMRKVPGRFQDGASQFDIQNARNIWGTVKKIILLKGEKNIKKRRKMINQYIGMRKGYVKEVKPKGSVECCTTFFDGLFYPKHEVMLNDVVKAMKSAKNINNDEFEKLRDFYREYYLKESESRYISLIDEYFKCRVELGQMLIHARISDGETKEKVVGSRNFEDVKLFYGQCYEVITTQFLVFACLSNILKGRKYDEFESMSLNKYINDVSKANKHNPFKDVPNFEPFFKYLDSSLRNGSHHASFWREGEIIYYRSGGTGAKREMSYSHYLYLCNELIIAATTMFCFELIAFSDD